MLSQEKVFDDRDEWRLLADELSLLSAPTESRMVSILLRVIMEKGPEEKMSSEHTYSNRVMATMGREDGGGGDLQPSGCPVLPVKAFIQIFCVDSWGQRPGETSFPEANKEIAGRGFGDA